jgi:hypothetical protein
LRPHRKGADFAEGIDNGARFGGRHSASRGRGYGLRERQAVKPVVDLVVGGIEYFHIVRICVVRGTDIEQRCCPAFRLQ